MTPERRIAIETGHGDKDDHWDPGACGAEGCEADWTADLGAALRRALEARDWSVLLVTSGSLSRRAAQVDAYGPAVSLHLHGDTGRPGLYYFPGSTAGASYAMRICQALAWTGLDAGGPSWRWSPAALDTVPRAHALLGRERCPSVLLELVNQTDGPDVRWLRAHLDDVARSIAEGVTSGP